MKLFTEATNLDLTDPTNHPNGQLKDATNTTAKDGTRINKTLLADIRTVFTRALKLTGIVPNGNFDTDNESQLFDACFGTAKVPITTFYNGVESGDSVGLNALRCWKENGGKTIRIEGWISMEGTQNSQDIFILPAGFAIQNDFSLMAIGYTVNQADSRIHFKADSQKFFLYGTLSAIAYINWSIPID